MPRTVSLDVKYPLLMTALALGISAVFVGLGHRELRRVLEASAGDRLHDAGAVISSMLGASAAPIGGRVRALAARPEVRAALGDAPAPATLAAARAAVRPAPSDSGLLGVRLIDRAGTARGLFGAAPADGAVDWARDAARDGRLSPRAPTFGPFEPAGEGVALVIAAPVHARDDGESLVGWLVETRRVQGAGVASIRQLVGSATLIVGSLDGGVWTDLDGVQPGPPPGVVANERIVFEASPRGAGVGIATPVAGTPWVVWLQRDRESVLAPLADFRRRVAPVALLLALVTLVVVWRASHGVTHRIVELTHRVDRMAADPTVAEAKVPSPVGLEGRDEIERLERSFDAMFDRTRRQMQLEAQLLQAQKLEAIGRLAGGIAHDFNNVLTIITSYGESLRAVAPEGSPSAADLEQLLGAADRAARLTRQLLAFSRQQVVRAQPIDLDAVIRDGHELLRRLIPAHVEVRLDLAEAIPAVLADPIQVEQVLINLAVNAADAMPDGGRLTFRTSVGERVLDADTPGAAARPCAILVAEDTGHGMDEETLARVFDPFFTTKAQGKGTGLGLATVHGIVTQLGGRVHVESAPGRGTRFEVALPFA